MLKIFIVTHRAYIGLGTTHAIRNVAGYTKVVLRIKSIEIHADSTSLVIIHTFIASFQTATESASHVIKQLKSIIADLADLLITALHAVGSSTILAESGSIGSLSISTLLTSIISFIITKANLAAHTVSI